jgi:sulfate adenylyltransferase
MVQLIPPHGGELVDLRVAEERAEELRAKSRDWPSWTLTELQRCDLELLANGGFSPLTGFLNRGDFESVCSEMRLADGTLWPMPITLDVTEELAGELQYGASLALRDPEGVMLAVLHVEDVWRPDQGAEARAVFGTDNTSHPGVARTLGQNPIYVGGSLEVLQLPRHYDFLELRRTPAEVRAVFEERGWDRVVAFQTRNPMHRVHVELTRRAAEQVGANLLINPVVGMTKPGDVDHYTRVRVYKDIVERYPEGTAELSLLPLAMRMGGPREAVWHALIRRNHGCTHLIVGRDHAGPGEDPETGEPFYGPYEAQELVTEYEDEIGVEMVPFKMMVYVEEEEGYLPVDEIPEGETTLSISGTELRRRLETGEELPEWFTYPEVDEELRRSYRPLRERGFVVFFTGLSGSGKSTVANVLMVKLLEQGGRNVTMLDGDLVRQMLSSELTFSKEHRDLNIRRIGFVASEAAKHGGAVICAPIAPYESVRQEVRDLVEATGAGFILVHVATPLEVAEERDPKGLYAKARAGIIKGFTGIDDPYEEPPAPEVTIDTTDLTPLESAQVVLDELRREGYLG